MKLFLNYVRVATMVVALLKNIMVSVLDIINILNNKHEYEYVKYEEI